MGTDNKTVDIVGGVMVIVAIALKQSTLDILERVCEGEPEATRAVRAL